MLKIGRTRGLREDYRPRLPVLAVSLLLLAPVACGKDSKANSGSGGQGGAAAAAGRGGSAGGRGGTGGGGGAVAGLGGTSGSGGNAGGGGALAGSGGSSSGGAGGSGGIAGAGGGGAGSGGSGGTGGGDAGGGGSGGTGGGGTAGTGGGAGVGGSGGTAGAGGIGGAGGSAGTGGGGGTGGSAGAAGTGGSEPNCVLPPTDAGVPAAMPDNVMFLPNVTVTTLAGGPTPGTANGAFGVGMLDNPVSVAIEASGSLVVSDFDNSRLRRVVAADGTLSTLTVQIGFQRPFGLAVAGSVLYAQTDTNPSGMRNTTTGTIWQIDGATGVATAIGPNLGRPRGIAALSDGRLVLGDYQNQRVRIFNPATGVVSDLAGTQGCPGSANGTGADARFVQPYGVAVLPGDRIIVADYGAHLLREVSLAGVVTSFAGDGVMATIDGPRAGARFVAPSAVAADATGGLFVSDIGAHRIRRIAADGTVTTVAGDGTGGFMDGQGNVAQFYGQEGIAVSANGATIYVADGTLGGEPPGPYHRIRKITIGP
jgi:sugar lactone lactonase YvrE